MFLLPLLLACLDQVPPDGCADGYSSGFDLGFSAGAGCAELKGDVECSSAGVDLCAYDEAYEHCHGIGFLDGYDAALQRFRNECDVTVEPCSGALPSCMGG